MNLNLMAVVEVKRMMTNRIKTGPIFVHMLNVTKLLLIMIISEAHIHMKCSAFNHYKS